MNAPCKDCPDRALACHDTCSKYQAFLRENNNRKALISAERALNQTLNGYRKGKFDGAGLRRHK